MAPQFLISTETCFVMEGQTATLSCELNKPEQEVTWFRNGEQILPSERIEIIREGLNQHLVIHETTLFDQAEYIMKLEDKEIAIQLVVEGI